MFCPADFIKDLKQLLLEENIMYVDAEYKLLGTSHAEAGAYLLSLWGISDEIVEAVAFHHKPSNIKDVKFSILTAVHISNAVEHIMPHIDTKHLKYLDISANLVDYIDTVK